MYEITLGFFVAKKAQREGRLYIKYHYRVHLKDNK